MDLQSQRSLQVPDFENLWRVFGFSAIKLMDVGPKIFASDLFHAKSGLFHICETFYAMSKIVLKTMIDSCLIR